MTRVRLSDLDYTSDVPALPLGPPPGADTRLRARATLHAWDAATWHAVLANPDDGTAGSVVPAIGDQDWASLVGKPIWVLRDPIDGRHLLALGPVVPTSVARPAPAPLPAPLSLTQRRLFPPETVTRTVTVHPTWTGTYRPGYGWGAWSTPGDGGPSTLYQGTGPGSGQLVGLATYGNRITALDAETITSATVLIRRASTGANQPVRRRVILQGAEHPSQPAGGPEPAGPRVAARPVADTYAVPLPAELTEAMRTGQVRSLAAVGDTYTAIRGTSSPDGMSLRITYTRTE